MLTESCVMFFFAVPCCCKHYIARWIFWPWRLELKKETRQAAISLWRQLELTPNYLISYLKNTGSRSTRYVSMPHPNESSILPKFLEKSDPEVARPAFSTWPVQKSQPKAFEVCASIQIHQSVYRDHWQFKTTTLTHTDVCLVAIRWLVDFNQLAHLKWLWLRFLHRSCWESWSCNLRITFFEKFCYFWGKKLNSLASVPA